ncbi:hypothetical protein CPB85DRAFT_1431361 [Mucidula mucida]|nr:hypothetical protein CPB85DRAFT_1431361 [Mucidula mucida]
MYNPPKGVSRASSSKAASPLTPTTNSPTHITIPQSPEERLLDPSSATSVSSRSRSTPASESKSSRVRGEFSFSDDKSIPLVEDQGLDELWGSLRQKKEQRLSKEKSKVASLEEAELDPPLSRRPPPPPQQKSVKKVKSVTTLNVSEDGRTVVAFFDMTGVLKENVHVNFKFPRIYISWFVETVTESEDEEGRIVIERIQKDYQRTLPVPEGTKFEEIRGTMNGRHLVLKFPNCRSFRVERVYDDAEADEY